MTAPREEGVSSGENFRPMGDPQQQFAGQLLGDPMNVQPMIAPAARSAVAAGKYAGPELARGLENYMVKSGGILPMDVYHGSPHRFPPTAKNPLGEFDSSKIGTGEGAQAYGHGLYLAENPATAKSYQTALAKDKKATDLNTKMDMVMVGDRKITDFNVDMDAALIDAARNGQDAVREHAAKSLARWSELANDASYPFRDYAKQKVAGYSELNGALSSKPVQYTGDGSLYKVDLPDEQIAKMLDWDKPLSQQAHIVDALTRGKSKYDEITRLANSLPDTVENVAKYNTLMAERKKYSGMIDALRPHRIDRYDGNALYHAISSGDRSAEAGLSKQAAETLKELGIPGIRYLDQGSRAGGAGTSNFVVFDPAHMNIIGRE